MLKKVLVVAAEGEAYVKAQSIAREVKSELARLGVMAHLSDEVDVPKYKPEMVIAIGGDATIMRAMKKYSPYSIPTFGINGGNVGFLTSAEADTWKNALERLLAGAYRTEDRFALVADYIPAGTDIVAESFGPAANEVVVEHLETQIAFGIEVGGTNFYGAEGLMARGVLVATATGSTAQNVSHGGPILMPTSRHVALTPISPYKLTTRPLVLDELEKGGSIDICPLQFKDNVGVQLLIDGRKVLPANGVNDVGATFKVRAATTPFLLVTFGPVAFARALQEKKGFAL